MSKPATPSELPERLELILPDLNGIPRGKVIDGADFDPENPPHMPGAIFFQSLTGHYVDAMSAYNPTDSDVLLAPDWNTLRSVPWKGTNRAQVLVGTVGKDGTPVPFDPRNLLLRVLDAYADLGLSPVIAPEVEFFLLNPLTTHAPFEPAVGAHGRLEQGGEAFSIDALGKYTAFIDRLESCCAETGLALSGIVHEMGPAQVELNLAHGPALDRADQLFLLKRVVKACAEAEGFNASFMAKPLSDQAGSGLHLHVSAYRDGENVFALENGVAGAALRHFIGGLAHYLPDAFALIAPNVNSYKRFRPDSSAPINLAWGYDNRTTGLRVPFDKDANGRVENRVAGADANPYLCVAATLACGLLGIQEAIEPAAAVDSDAYEMTADLPRDLGQALDRLNASTALGEMLGESFIDVFSAVKRDELNDFQSEVSPWERRYLGAEL